MVCYPTSVYIIFSLGKVKFYQGWGPGTGGRITQTPINLFKEMKSTYVINIDFIIISDSKTVYISKQLVGDYMIAAYRDEIFYPSSRDGFHPTITCGNYKYCPGKEAQFSTCYVIRSACIFFGFFFVSMLFYKTEDSYISIDLKNFYLSCLVFSCVHSFS